MSALTPTPLGLNGAPVNPAAAMSLSKAPPAVSTQHTFATPNPPSSDQMSSSFAAALRNLAKNASGSPAAKEINRAETTLASSARCIPVPAAAQQHRRQPHFKPPTTVTPLQPAATPPQFSVNPSLFDVRKVKKDCRSNGRNG